MTDFDHSRPAAVRWSVEFPDVAALDRALEEELRRGGLFVPDATGLGLGDECMVVLIHPACDREIAIDAVVVYAAEDGGGVGVAFRDFGPELRDALDAFGAQVGESRAAPQPGAGSDRGPNVHERLRGLNPSEQVKVARGGEVNERVILERLYGKAVWEPLLRNPRLTIPEVARLARMGNLPRPQLETIVANPAWLSAPEVRRALLTNRRMSGVMIQKVLRAMPKAELKLASKQTVYPSAVREAAHKLIKI